MLILRSIRRVHCIMQYTLIFIVIMIFIVIIVDSVCVFICKKYKRNSYKTQMYCNGACRPCSVTFVQLDRRRCYMREVQYGKVL